MKDVITAPCINIKEKEFEYRSSQNIIYLLEKLILATNNENDLIIDSFADAGTSSSGCL
ncbi:site-specific DNA-methyltransferase [Mycoplasmopsis cynos]|uniref:site-specific DNA-methyltransferase n=1 Tax=Mycoplasmopsis cynos TaxID=171284 RepID=UPI002209DBC0|nr:site-specific DNA-methyltransferase [Mycoplasmopsis cynos]UWV82738.1 site-specific DNA-methyltransferase [Mycoplasmopsis cynos]